VGFIFFILQNSFYKVFFCPNAVKCRLASLEFHKIIQKFVTLFTLSEPLKSIQKNPDELTVYRITGSKPKAMRFSSLL